MIEFTVKELTYNPNSALIFERLLGLPWPIFLDSGKAQGRYDILTAKPWATLCTHEETSQLVTPGGQFVSREDPFQLIQQMLQELPIDPQVNTELPFIGGAMGYFAYDLARWIEVIPTLAVGDINMPDLALGFYTWAIIVDHYQEQTVLVAHLIDDAMRSFVDELLQSLNNPHPPRQDQFEVFSPMQAEMHKSDYLASIARIQNYLLAGDCYQVNFTQRFHAQVSGCGWSLYQSLRQHDASPFAAYMHMPEGEVLSFSPERFLQVDNDKVVSQPIKGTRPRDNNIEMDERLAQELAVSEKDRAENLMIVDLMRNDLSKNCYPGSVQVPELCALHRYTHVHHLVSTVTGYVATDPVSLLRGCFPAGSITGAPKIRAMEIIEELEPVRRSVYCGSIAYISINGKFDSNVAIRSLVYQQDNLYCYAGGGITADSIAEHEYKESFDKIRWVIEAIDNLRASPSSSV